MLEGRGTRAAQWKGARVNPDPSTQAKEVAISRAEYAALKADKERLDYLDQCNRRLNAASGTVYGWEMIQSPNVNRLMLDGFKHGVDINDAKAVGCHPTGHLSVRNAIDHANGYRTGDAPEPDYLVNEKLIQWANDWELDGDLVRCRSCKRGIIYSRRDEKLVHSADCKTWAAYPWELLIALAPPRIKNDQSSVSAAP